MTIIMFKVEEEDILHGHRGQMGQCPIALAMGRNGLIQPFVTADSVSFGFNGKRYYAKLDAQMKEFVTTFDDGLYVEPQIFSIQLPE